MPLRPLYLLCRCVTGWGETGAHSQRAERGFLDDVSLPWCQQVVVMFQILCALVLDVPAAAELRIFMEFRRMYF